MSDFLLHKVAPVLLTLFGITCIDTPGNFVRKSMLEIITTVQSVLDDLPTRVF